MVIAIRAITTDKGGGEVIWERERRIQKEKRWKRIRNSRFNKWYGMMKGEGLPGYLKKA